MRYSPAAWRPLSNNVGGAIVPRAVVWHTAVDAASTTSLFGWFNSPARKGTSAHGFIAGNGSMEQYIDTNRLAGHAFAANHFALGIETHDAGHPSNPWTGAQVLRMVDVMHWCRDALGIPIKPIEGPSGSGHGYHSEFGTWNQSGHQCPGPVRVAQLGQIIALAAAVHPNPTPTPNPPPDFRRLAAGQWLPWVELLATPMSPQTAPGNAITLVQKSLNLVQGSTLILNGIYDTATADAVWTFQQAINRIRPITDAFPGVFSAQTKFWLCADLSNIATGVTP